MGFVHDCLATDLVPATSVVEQVFAAGTPTGMQAQAEAMHVLTPGKKYIATRESSTGARVYVEFTAITGLAGAHDNTNLVDIIAVSEERYRGFLTEEDPLQDRVEKVQFLGRRFFVNDRMPFTEVTEFDLFEHVA
jgi:hypothetical protein